VCQLLENSSYNETVTMGSNVNILICSYSVPLPPPQKKQKTNKHKTIVSTKKYAAIIFCFQVHKIQQYGNETEDCKWFRLTPLDTELTAKATPDEVI
jgi:hypothetical protein